MTSPVEEALERLGSPRDVHERHGGEVRHGRGRCLLHPDRDPSVSFYTDKFGRERWKCFGCELGGDAIDLARLLGETVELGRPAKSPPQPKPKPTPAQRDLARILARRDSIGFEVGAALSLARVHQHAQEQEIERNREWLEEFGSVDFIAELANRIRPWLFERYGVPTGFVWPQQTIWAAFDELVRRAPC